MFREVAVTGLGVLTSIGEDVLSFADGLRTGACGIRFDPLDGLGVAARLPGFSLSGRVASMDLPDEIRGRALRAGHRLPLSAQVSLLTALEACVPVLRHGIADSFSATNLIVAGNNVSPAYQYSVYEKYRSRLDFVPASYALHFQDTSHVGVLSEVLGVRGEGMTVGNASASGGMALVQAWRQIRHGLCDRCLVVGAMTDLSPVEHAAFRNSGALGGLDTAQDARAVCRPFDLDRQGFVYGQGGACLLLEAADSATARGAKVYAELAGAAACMDANRMSDPSAAGEARAMRMALREAGVRPETVDYVNTHGTGSVLGDATEVEALKEVLGEQVAKAISNSTKGLTGHCMTAAGVVEAVATVLQMNGGFVHPNRNLERPLDDMVKFAGNTSLPGAPAVALSNSFGFGGLNCSVVFVQPAEL